MQNQNLVVFDFCDTLVNFQTAGPFLDEVIQQFRPNRRSLLKLSHAILGKFRIYALTNKFWPALNLSKRVQLLFCRGISEKDFYDLAQNFYLKSIKPNIIHRVYQKMLEHISQGDTVIISSGGYQPYLEIFCSEHSIKTLFCTRIEFKNGSATGFFNGKDCMRNQKLVLLNQFINLGKINLDKTFCYSDSDSDLPILNWADKAVVISKNNPQNWAKTMNFEEWIIEQ